MQLAAHIWSDFDGLVADLVHAARHPVFPVSSVTVLVHPLFVSRIEIPDTMPCFAIHTEQGATGTRTGLCTRGSTAMDASTARAERPSLQGTATPGSGRKAPCRALACTSSRQRELGTEGV